MKKDNVKLFICTHPNSLLAYRNFARIIKKHNKDVPIILFKVNHPYFLNLDFESYKKYFDRIVEFDFVHYYRNFFFGILKALIFQKKIKDTINNLLVNFKTIDLFLYNSTWLPPNILLYNLSSLNNIGKIFRFSWWEEKPSDIKVDKTKTLFCNLYSLFLKCYRVKVITTSGGKFAGFVYADKIPGNLVKLTNPFEEPARVYNNKKETVLPYPIISDSFKKKGEKDMVIIFGDTDVFNHYSEYVLDYKIAVNRLSIFFNTVKEKYRGCKLYYKPHPTNKGGIMPGIDISEYSLFDNTINTEMLFDKYQNKIKATYSFSSTSTIIGSFFGTPSYTFYRYLCNPLGIKRFDALFNEKGIKCKFLFHITDLSEIGKIDDTKRPDNYNYTDMDKAYLKVLNI